MILADKVFDLFTQINQIPRGSGNELAISDWLKKFAIKNSWQVTQDDVHNIIIKVPGTFELAKNDAVILQGHMDMVCVKAPDSTHDFTTDPIETYADDGWLKAKGTTMGADNGIALAIALAIASDPDVAHPPLELLFTTEEEIGLNGASALDEHCLSGKYLINIDSEDEGVFTIGCAGGRDTNISIQLRYDDNKQETPAYELSISGLSGGHSGIQIVEQKANAIQLAAHCLNKLIDACDDFHLCFLKGGIAHNAIPTETQFIFTTSQEDKAKQTVNEMFQIFERELRAFEPNMTLSYRQTITPQAYFSTAISQKIIRILLALPHGVLLMTRGTPHMVETSSNIAVINTDLTFCNILVSQRSSKPYKLDFITKKIEAIATLAGATFRTTTGYPSWEPDFNSALLKKSVQVYKQLFGKEPMIEVIHAGLECGILGSKYPHLQMLSIGPTIKNPHTTSEKMLIADVEKIVKFLLELLKQL